MLYLLHGYSDDPTAWSAVGRANVILDNLIARGQAKPMIIVMPLGYGTTDILKDGWRGHHPGAGDLNVSKFGDALLGEVIPQVEKAYRVSKDRSSRAIAGLSMGGQESLTVGLNHLDKFAWVGAFSSGGLANFPAHFPTLDASANRQLHLLWISCGHDDKLLESNQHFRDWLQTQGVQYTWVEPPGIHSFRVWRRNLAAFAPLLFQEKK